MQDMGKPDGRQIKINFRAAEMATIEKDVGGGVKHRYLAGTATGPKWDAHGERMTDACLEGLVAQAQSGDILLYPDVHGIRATEDIGILTLFKTLDNGDWYTEYRLYGESDGVDSKSLETADKLWKQMNGLPPYTKPRKKGFSIEGYIPVDKILMRQQQQLIDGMILQGVVVVPQPAYRDSVAHAIYKALGETPPWVAQNGIRARLREKLVEQEAEQAYNSERWDVDSAKDELIREIMHEPGEDAEERLRMVFQEYSEIMIELILKSAALFIEDDVSKSEPAEASPYAAHVAKDELLRQLGAEVGRLAAFRGVSK